MKLTTPQAKRQVSRLAGLPRFAELGEAGIGELIRVLCQYSLSDDHAARTVTAWLNSHKWLPSCAELIDLLELVPERDNIAAMKSRHCERCQGYGWEEIHLLVTYNLHPNGAVKASEEQEITKEVYEQLWQSVDGRSQIVSTAVKACRCDYGKYLKAARIARANETEQRRVAC